MNRQSIKLLLALVAGALPTVAADPAAAPEIETSVVETVPIVWHTRFFPAMNEAKAAKKILVIYFHLQDACPWCAKQEKEVFSTKEFAAYARDNLVLLKVDCGPKAKALPEATQKEYKALAQDFAVAQTGFPTLIFINPQTDVTTKQARYIGGGPKAFIAQTERVK